MESRFRIFVNMLLVIALAVSPILFSSLTISAQIPTSTGEITVDDAKKFLSEKIPLWTFYNFGSFTSIENQFSIPTLIQLKGSIKRFDYRGERESEPNFGGTFTNSIKVGKLKLQRDEFSVSSDLSRLDFSYLTNYNDLNIQAFADITVNLTKFSYDCNCYEKSTLYESKTSKNLFKVLRFKKGIDLRLVNSFSLKKSDFDQSFYIVAESTEGKVITDEITFEVEYFKPYYDVRIYDPEKDPAFDVASKYSKMPKIKAVANVIGESEGKRLCNALNFLVKAYKKANPEKF